jgi:putative RecB family exonuclease
MRVFSHSRLSSFESCPMQYRLRYIDEVDIERRETVESFLGRRVHETLQFFYERLASGMRLSEGDLLAHLSSSWQRNWHRNVKIVRADQSVEDYRAFAEKCLRNYYRDNAPFDRGTTVATEMAVLFSLDPSRQLQIRGYIDRLVGLGPGVYEIHDYKTSRRLPTTRDIQRDRQLALYQMAVVHMLPDVREVTLVWHYLAFGRRLASSRTPEQLAALRQETAALVDRIDEATARNEFPPRVSRLCDWCDYRHACPAWVPTQAALEFGVPIPAPPFSSATES